MWTLRTKNFSTLETNEKKPCYFKKRLQRENSGIWRQIEKGGGLVVYQKRIDHGVTPLLFHPEKGKSSSLSLFGSATVAARWTQLLTFQTVEAAKRKIQEKRQAGFQGQNPQPRKKGQKAKKNRRTEECGFPTRICTVLSGCNHPRPKTRRKWSPDHKNKNRLEGNREEEARWILSDGERHKTGQFLQLDSRGSLSLLRDLISSHTFLPCCKIMSHSWFSWNDPFLESILNLYSEAHWYRARFSLNLSYVFLLVKLWWRRN